MNEKIEREAPEASQAAEQEAPAQGLPTAQGDVEQLIEDLLNRPMSRGLSTPAVANLVPRNFEDMWRYCEMIATSDLVPKDYRGRPANCWIAIESGMAVGLSPAQSLQNIAVVNGRPSLYGPIGLAIVRTHREFGGIEESFDPPLRELDGSNKAFQAANLTAHCTLYRMRDGDLETTTRSFSVADAERAKLWGRDTYAAYGPRMLQYRARWWAMQDGFGDALGGLPSAEEQQALPPGTRESAAEQRSARTADLAERLGAKVLSSKNGAPAASQTPSRASKASGPPMTLAELLADLAKTTDPAELADLLAVINDWPDAQEKKQLGGAYRAQRLKIDGAKS